MMPRRLTSTNNNTTSTNTYGNGNGDGNGNGIIHDNEAPGSPAPSTPGTSSTVAGVKSRRSHRKSRNGCAECKRRHIRCDERRPVCSNCSIAERACAYPTSAAGPSSVVSPPLSGEASFRSLVTPQASATAGNLLQQDDLSAPRHQHQRSFANPSPVSDHSNAWTPGAINPTPPLPPSPYTKPYQSRSLPHPSTTITTPTGSSFTSLDLMILHHAQTNMDYGGVGPAGQLEQIISIAIRHAFDAPYLLDQVLALAAIHLSLQLTPSLPPSSGIATPASRTSVPASTPTATASSSSSLPKLSPLTPLSPSAMRHHATVLQTRAVASFTRLTADIAPNDTATSVTRFLFSSVLSLHALAETLSVLGNEDMDFHSFIDSFVDCFNLHRGVRAIIGPITQYLCQSELQPLLSITQDFTLNTGPPGSECRPLMDLLDSSDLGTTSLDACRAAVSTLQWTFDMYNRISYRNGPHAASAFSVTVPVEYLDVLRKHRPEALVILSYYGVLLHRCRGYWMFRDSGALLVRAIAKHLGTYWQDSIAWPLHIIEVERD